MRWEEDGQLCLPQGCLGAATLGCFFLHQIAQIYQMPTQGPPQPVINLLCWTRCSKGFTFSIVLSNVPLYFWQPTTVYVALVFCPLFAKLKLKRIFWRKFCTSHYWGLWLKRTIDSFVKAVSFMFDLFAFFCSSFQRSHEWSMTIIRCWQTLFFGICQSENNRFLRIDNYFQRLFYFRLFQGWWFLCKNIYHDTQFFQIYLFNFPLLLDVAHNCCKRMIRVPTAYQS